MDMEVKPEDQKNNQNPILVKAGKFFLLRHGLQKGKNKMSDGSFMAVGMEIIPGALYPTQLFNFSSESADPNALGCTQIVTSPTQPEQISVNLIVMMSAKAKTDNEQGHCSARGAVYICDKDQPVNSCLKDMQQLYISKSGISILSACKDKLDITEKYTAAGLGLTNLRISKVQPSDKQADFCVNHALKIEPRDDDVVPASENTEEVKPCALFKVESSGEARVTKVKEHRKQHLPQIQAVVSANNPLVDHHDHKKAHTCSTNAKIEDVTIPLCNSISLSAGQKNKQNTGEQLILSKSANYNSDKCSVAPITNLEKFVSRKKEEFSTSTQFGNSQVLPNVPHLSNPHTSLQYTVLPQASTSFGQQYTILHQNNGLTGLPYTLVPPMSATEPYKLAPPTNPGEPFTLIPPMSNAEPLKLAPPANPGEPFTLLSPMSNSEPFKLAQPSNLGEPLSLIPPMGNPEPYKLAPPTNPGEPFSLIQPANNTNPSNLAPPTSTTAQNTGVPVLGNKPNMILPNNLTLASSGECNQEANISSQVCLPQVKNHLDVLQSSSVPIDSFISTATPQIGSPEVVQRNGNRVGLSTAYQENNYQTKVKAEIDSYIHGVPAGRNEIQVDEKPNISIVKQEHETEEVVISKSDHGDNLKDLTGDFKRRGDESNEADRITTHVLRVVLSKKEVSRVVEHSDDNKGEETSCDETEDVLENQDDGERHHNMSEDSENLEQQVSDGDEETRIIDTTPVRRRGLPETEDVLENQVDGERHHYMSEDSEKLEQQVSDGDEETRFIETTPVRRRGLPSRKAARSCVYRLTSKRKCMFQDESAYGWSNVRPKRKHAFKKTNEKSKNEDQDYEVSSKESSNSESSDRSDSSESEEEGSSVKSVDRFKCEQCAFLHCNRRATKSCFICHPSAVITNAETPLQRHPEDHDLPDLPEILKYVKTEENGSSRIILAAKNALSEGTKLGPVVGEHLPIDELKFSQCLEPYYWPSHNGSVVRVYDTSNLERSNWCHFLTGNDEGGNLFQVIEGDQVYFVTTKAIAKEEPLTVLPNNRLTVSNRRTFSAERSGLLECRRCEQKYEDLLTLLKHIVIFHPFPSYIKPFNCATCGLLIYTKKQKKEHSRQHRGQIQECHICGTRVLNLQSHVKHRHSKGPKSRPFRCKDCGKSFASVGTLNCHKKRIHPPQLLKCSKCPKEFKTLAVLEKHERYHMKEYTCACDRCGKQFVEKNNLLVHMLTHSGKKPFNCRKCDMGFTTKQSLQGHYRNKHGYSDSIMPKITRDFPLKYNS